MKIGRTLAPAAAPLSWRDLWHGLRGAARPAATLTAREEEFKRELGVKSVFFVSSGCGALALALKALKTLSPRTDVVVPAYTCFSVPAAVFAARLRPVLCDIDPVTFDFDHDQLSRTVNSNTLCVVAHHLFGIPSDITRIRTISERCGAFVIEDAAQALGIRSGGHMLGTQGDAGIFSFGRGKNVTCGSGGAVVTSSPNVEEALAAAYREVPVPGGLERLADLLKAFIMAIFIRPWLYWIPVALPFLKLGQTIFPTGISIKRLSCVKAGLLQNWQARVHAANAVRSHSAAYYCRELPRGLQGRTPHPYLRLPVLLENAAEKQLLFGASDVNDLGLSPAYPAPLSHIPAVRASANGREFPNAARVAAKLVTLPTHQWLTDRDKRAVAAFLRERGAA